MSHKAMLFGSGPLLGCCGGLSSAGGFNGAVGCPDGVPVKGDGGTEGADGVIVPSEFACSLASSRASSSSRPGLSDLSGWITFLLAIVTLLLIVGWPGVGVDCGSGALCTGGVGAVVALSETVGAEGVVRSLTALASNASSDEVSGTGAWAGFAPCWLAAAASGCVRLLLIKSSICVCIAACSSAVGVASARTVVSADWAAGAGWSGTGWGVGVVGRGIILAGVTTGTSVRSGGETGAGTGGTGGTGVGEMLGTGVGVVGGCGACSGAATGVSGSGLGTTGTGSLWGGTEAGGTAGDGTAAGG